VADYSGNENEWSTVINANAPPSYNDSSVSVDMAAPLKLRPYGVKPFSLQIIHKSVCYYYYYECDDT